MIHINKNSYSVLELDITYKTDPDSSFSDFDLTSTTATFTMSRSLKENASVYKISTDSSQIAYTYPLNGTLQVYINASDTELLNAGKYMYTVYVTDSSNRKFVVKTDVIMLLDSVSDTC